MTDLRQAAQQAEPPPEWPLIKNILAVFGLDAISFVAKWQAAQRPWQELTDKDWDQMAVLVEQSQEQTAKIEQLEAQKLQDRNAMDAMKLANEQWTQECRRLEKKLD